MIYYNVILHDAFTVLVLMLFYMTIFVQECNFLELHYLRSGYPGAVQSVALKF